MCLLKQCIERAFTSNTATSNIKVILAEHPFSLGHFEIGGSLNAGKT